MKKKLSFTSDPGELAEVRASIREFLEECGFDECAGELLVLALDEACTNIIRHAYHREIKPVRLEMERTFEELRFTLRDYGKSCDPKKIKSRELKDIRPGGVGVHIIKKAFDEVVYEPRPRGTRLRLIKKLQPCQASGQAAEARDATSCS